MATPTHDRIASQTTDPTPEEFKRSLQEFHDDQIRLHEGYAEGIRCLKAMVTNLQNENQVMKRKIEENSKNWSVFIEEVTRASAVLHDEMRDIRNNWRML